MNLEKGQWTFNNKDTVEIFDEHVQQSVPFYQEIQNLVKDLSTWFLQDNTNYYDIGASTGNTAINIMENSSKKVKYNLIDNSTAMCDYLKTNVYDASIIETDLSTDDNFTFNNASLITSILTLQFIPIHKRQEIVKKVYNGLNKGSAFIMIEKTPAQLSHFDNIMNGLYYDFKLEQGLDEKHIINKSQSLRGVMNPISVEENKKMLEQAGFNNIEVFFKWCNFTGFIAIK